MIIRADDLSFEAAPAPERLRSNAASRPL